MTTKKTSRTRVNRRRSDENTTFVRSKSDGVISGGTIKATWQLRDAKASFSEVVRRAQTSGPQRVTVRGREEVYVVRGSEFRRMKGDATGKALVELFVGSPLQDVAIERESLPMPVRDVEL